MAETLNTNNIISTHTDFHQTLIHQATLKMTGWINCKLNKILTRQFDRVNFLGDNNVNFTLNYQVFPMALFFTIEFNQNGVSEFTNNVDFNCADFAHKEDDSYLELT